MPRERIHDRIDGSRHIEKSLNDPSGRSKSGKHGATDAKNRVRTGSTHKDQGWQDGRDDDHLHSLNAQIEGQNPSNAVPAAQSQPPQGSGESQAVNETEECGDQSLFAGEDGTASVNSRNQD